MKDKIRCMVEDGFAAKRIATKLRLNFKYVQNLIKENDFHIKKEKFNDKLISRILSLYNSGVSAKNIGIKYSIDKRRVQKWARQKGVERSRNESHRFSIFNENYFDDINTPAKAYWLGFLYADAYNDDIVNTVCLALKKDDIDHLYKLSDALSIKRNQISYKKNKEGHEYCTLRIYSKHICNKLTELGYPRAKSFIIKYPQWLRDNLHNHFIRGLFDGDGSLKCNKKTKEWTWRLTSTKDICDPINILFSKELSLYTQTYYISDSENNTWQMETAGNEKIHKILKWLYNDSTEDIRLSRKYYRYEKLVDQQNNRKINRNSYLLSDEIKHNIINDQSNNVIVAKKHNVHKATVNRLKKSANDFTDIIEIEGQPLTAKFIKTLSKDEREKYVEPLFKLFRERGWIYYTVNNDKLIRDYKKICDFDPDLSQNELNMNTSLGTDICKHFCNSFFNACKAIECWNDDKSLRELIRNRLVINWNSKVDETFNISHRMMFQGMRSKRLVEPISIFKPTIAKYVCLKYSSPGDLVGDFSAGFGGRLLGAMASGRRYIGIDPLTVSELNDMVKFFNFDNCQLISACSEHYCGDENSVDLYWSSPPYYKKEIYSNAKSQSYNKGEDYFYNVYWPKTLKNVKYMLKPGKWFGLNVADDKMLEIAKKYFGDVKDTVNLRLRRSHLNRSAGEFKYEYIYMFVNDK